MPPKLRQCIHNPTVGKVARFYAGTPKMKDRRYDVDLNENTLPKQCLSKNEIVTL